MSAPREMPTDLFTTLAEAKAWLEDHVEMPGAICPCCDRFDAVYTRDVNRAALGDLMSLYRHTKRVGPGFYHYSEYMRGVMRHGDFAKFRHVGLIEIAVNHKTNKRTSGTYGITEAGIMFIEGRLAIPAKMVIYHDELVDTRGYDLGRVGTAHRCELNRPTRT